MKDLENKQKTIEGALRRASYCFTGAGIEQPRDEAEILLAELMGWSRLELFLERSSILENHSAAVFEKAVERRSRGEPAAYITGNREFYGLEFIVNRDVLIPRPETELLVDAVLEWARNRAGNICGVDLGSGSGNLAVALTYHLPHSTFYAVDLSKKALQLAAANAVRHGVSGQIRFCQSDYFDVFSRMELPPRFNLIVANPPYLTSAEMGNLPPTIRDYEPRLALEGGQDGLNAYRSILGALPSFIRGPGLVALEIGSTQGAAILSLCRQLSIFHKLTLLHDYRDLPRILLGSF